MEPEGKIKVNIASAIEEQKKRLKMEQAMLTLFADDPRTAGYHAGRITEIREIIQMLEAEMEEP